MAKKRFPSTRNRQEDKMVRNLDNLSKYDEFIQNLLPALQKDLAAGLTAEQLLAKYNAVAAARVITTAARSENDSAALAAARDLLDRTSGKATEKIEFSQKVEKLSDEELDVLLRQYTEVADGSEDTIQ